MAGGDELRFQNGLRLFRRRRYFEAHEAWESLWLETEGPRREFLQGMIQAAVCLHHASSGNRRGARWLRARCGARLSGLGKVWGVDCRKFLAALDRALNDTKQ